ncbi:MAG: class I SAM-dependent methyltransferase [Planctomycetes bacterium]|nr:class I SAM-dependent methyltransferase [Planctomycetota bacterium]
MAKPWFEQAFGPQYLQVYQHRSEEQAQAQVAAMQSCGLLPRAGRVLDIACGTGRHLRAMRAAGLHAWGLDYSRHLLSAGKLAGLAVRADMRDIPFADQRFDWACSCFTSFGYFESDQQDLRMFRAAARVLVIGGCMVLDHINPAVTLRELKAETIEARDGMTILQRRRHDPAAGLIIKDIEVTKGGDVQRWSERVRYYQPAALQNLLQQAGLRVLKRCGELDGRPFDDQHSPRQVILAHRPN